MVDKRWKRRERRVAELLHGERSSVQGARSPDVTTPLYAVEGRHWVTRAFLEERSTKTGELRWPSWRTWTDRMAEKQAQRYAFRLAFPDLSIWAEEPDESAPGSDDMGPES